MTLNQIVESEFQIFKSINFISEELITLKNWEDADKLVFDIDPNDVHYVAYAKQFNAKIWSGDKKLFRGLIKKGFNEIVSTDDLYRFRDQRERVKKQRKSR